MDDDTLISTIAATCARVMKDYFSSSLPQRKWFLDEVTTAAACCMDLQSSGQPALQEMTWTGLVHLLGCNGSVLDEILPKGERIDLVALNTAGAAQPKKPRAIVEFKRDAKESGLRSDINRLKRLVVACGRDNILPLGVQVLCAAETYERDVARDRQVLEGLAKQLSLPEPAGESFSVRVPEEVDRHVHCGVFIIRI